MKTSFITLHLVVLVLTLANGQNIIQGSLPKNEIVYTCGPCGCEHDNAFFDSM